MSKALRGLSVSHPFLAAPIPERANVQALPLSILHGAGNPRITPILARNQEKGEHLKLKGWLINKRGNSR